jgi:hypothetical protein
VYLAQERIYIIMSHASIPPYSFIISQNQSTSTPLVLRSALAMSISFISSACASGTSLNVKTPKPSLNSRYAPKETRTQKGSYERDLVSHVLRGDSSGTGGIIAPRGVGKATYDG